MKKLIAGLILVLLTAACTPSDTQSGMMGMKNEKCCCQKMMEGDKSQCPMMKDGKPCCECCQKMADGDKVQCPMGKDGKPCECCQKMKDGGKEQCPMMKDGKPCCCKKGNKANTAQ